MRRSKCSDNFFVPLINILLVLQISTSAYRSTDPGRLAATLPHRAHVHDDQPPKAPHKHPKIAAARRTKAIFYRKPPPLGANMLLLDYQNVLLQSVLTERFSGYGVLYAPLNTQADLTSSLPPINIDQTVSDFDGVTFHISTPESKSKILVSIQVRCFNDLLQYGAQQVLEREYGPYVVAPEAGYDFSVQIDLDNLPDDKGLYLVDMFKGSS